MVQFSAGKIFCFSIANSVHTGSRDHPTSRPMNRVTRSPRWPLTSIWCCASTPQYVFTAWCLPIVLHLYFLPLLSLNETRSHCNSPSGSYDRSRIYHRTVSIKWSVDQKNHIPSMFRALLAVCSLPTFFFKKSVDFRRTTQYCIPEDGAVSATYSKLKF